MRALFIKKPGPTGLTITNMIRFIIGLFALFGLSQAGTHTLIIIILSRHDKKPKQFISEPGFTPDGFGDAFQDALSELPANRRDAFVR